LKGRVPAFRITPQNTSIGSTGVQGLKLGTYHEHSFEMKPQSNPFIGSPLYAKHPMVGVARNSSLSDSRSIEEELPDLPLPSAGGLKPSGIIKRNSKLMNHYQQQPRTGSSQ
jgi:hypothetical protein